MELPSNHISEPGDIQVGERFIWIVLEPKPIHKPIEELTLWFSFEYDTSISVKNFGVTFTSNIYIPCENYKIYRNGKLIFGSE